MGSRGEKRKLTETVSLHEENTRPLIKQDERGLKTMNDNIHANMTSASCSVLCVFFTSNMSLVKATFIVYVVEPFFHEEDLIGLFSVR